MGYPENPIEDDNQVVRPPSNIVILDDDLDVNNDSDDEENAYNGYQPLGMLDDDNMSDMDHVATIKLDEDDNDDNVSISKILKFVNSLTAVAKAYMLNLRIFFETNLKCITRGNVMLFSFTAGL